MKKLFTLIGATLLSSTLFAQNIYVHHNDGTAFGYNAADVDSIDFSLGNSKLAEPASDCEQNLKDPEYLLNAISAMLKAKDAEIADLKAQLANCSGSSADTSTIVADFVMPKAVANLIYSGEAHTLLTGESVGKTPGHFEYALGDQDYSATFPTAINAGEYAILCRFVTEGGKALAEEIYRVTILPKGIGLIWGDTHFLYDGTYHVPSVMTTEIIESDDVKVVVEGGETAPGTYIANAALTGENASNYKISESSSTIEYSIVGVKDETTTLGDYIAPAPITGLVYNGSAQFVMKVGTVGKTPGHFEYATGNESIMTMVPPTFRNAGVYSVTYSFIPDDSNLPEEKNTIEVTINPKEVSLVWSNTKLIYNGEKQMPMVSIDGIEDGDDVNIIVDGANSEVGRHTATIKLEGSDAYNYQLNMTTIPYEIVEANNE